MDMLMLVGGGGEMMQTVMAMMEARVVLVVERRRWSGECAPGPANSDTAAIVETSPYQRGAVLHV